MPVILVFSLFNVAILIKKTAFNSHACIDYKLTQDSTNLSCYFVDSEHTFYLVVISFEYIMDIIEKLVEYGTSL